MIITLLTTIFRIFTTIFVIFVLIIGLLNIFSNPNSRGLFGFKGYTVVSESMSPTLNTGDYILIKQIDKQALAPDQIITFKDEQMLVTHRILTLDQEWITTKGDHNPIQDMKQIKRDDVVGQYVFRIPLLGKVMILLQNPLWFSFIIGILVFRLIYLIVYHKQNVEENPKKVK
ncbi:MULTISPECIES: signal peptidase I [Enterococcus]|uniref:Signal peptidase I n=1 Tax=Enterococcus sulfureus ATCC 49903 TaxID=1140003 RepID=S0NX29_9ENTE|nr:signal peptidase I [Enterococcus sulfureus]EOT86152.1 signal peptidase I [Enterococcus sulfureus ATCC 49903]